MNCPNCGAGKRADTCIYCGTDLRSTAKSTRETTDAIQARDMEAELREPEINNLENQKRLIMNSPASEKVKQQKLARIEQKMSALRSL